MTFLWEKNIHKSRVHDLPMENIADKSQVFDLSMENNIHTSQLYDP